MGAGDLLAQLLARLLAEPRQRRQRLRDLGGWEPLAGTGGIQAGCLEGAGPLQETLEGAFSAVSTPTVGTEHEF